MRNLTKELIQTVPAMLNEEPRMTENVLHGSDYEESPINEIEIFKSLKKTY